MHYHLHALFLFMFFAGQFVHAWLKAQNVIQSSLNGVKDYRQYVSAYGAQVISRFFLAYCLFTLWVWHGPEVLDKIVQFFPTVAGMVPEGGTGRLIPVNSATCGIFGYFADSLIDAIVGLASKKWPGLQKEVPPEPVAKV